MKRVEELNGCIAAFHWCCVESQEIIERYGLEQLLLGMTSQLSEREDHIIVDDLRGILFTQRAFRLTTSTGDEKLPVLAV